MIPCKVAVITSRNAFCTGKASRFWRWSDGTLMAFCWCCSGAFEERLKNDRLQHRAPPVEIAREEYEALGLVASVMER